MPQFRFEKWLRQQKCRQRIAVSITTLVFSCGFGLQVYAQFRPDRPYFFERGQEQLEAEIDRLSQQQPEFIPRLDIDIDSPQWSPVLLRKGSGVVWMPQGIVTYETETVESADGSIDFEIVSTTSAIGRFVVAFSGEADTFASADPRELLDRVRTRIINDQTGFEEISDRVITFNDYPGRELVLQNDEEVITFRILLVRDRLYVMAVSQSTDSEQKEAIAAFFDSFQLL